MRQQKDADLYTVLQRKREEKDSLVVDPVGKGLLTNSSLTEIALKDLEAPGLSCCAHSASFQFITWLLGCTVFSRVERHSCYLVCFTSWECSGPTRLRTRLCRATVIQRQNTGCNGCHPGLSHAQCSLSSAPAHLPSQAGKPIPVVFFC